MKKFKFGIDQNQRVLLSFSIISTVLSGVIAPSLQKEIISSLPANFIAIQSIVALLAGVIAGHIWNSDKFREKILKVYLLLTFLESVAGFALAMYLTFIKYDVLVFAIASLIYTSLISTLVGKATSAFSNRLWEGRTRERYLNESSLWHSYAAIAGLVVAAVWVPNLKFSLLVWGFCCILDDAGWMMVYWKNRNFLDKAVLEEEKK